MREEVLITVNSLDINQAPQLLQDIRSAFDTGRSLRVDLHQERFAHAAAVQVLFYFAQLCEQTQRGFVIENISPELSANWRQAGLTCLTRG